MRVAVVSSSVLQSSGRWDAEFHVLADNLTERASALREDFDADRVMEMLAELRTGDLKALIPLTRSKRSDRADLLAAAREFPHLALAAVQLDLESILPAAIHEVELRQRYLDTVRGIAESLQSSPGMKP